LAARSDPEAEMFLYNLQQFFKNLFEFIWELTWRAIALALAGFAMGAIVAALSYCTGHDLTPHHLHVPEAGPE
jgi:hypothetical protein